MMMDDREILYKAFLKCGYSEKRASDCSLWIPIHNQTIETIFSHDFAKAFWGCEWVCSETGRTRKEYLDCYPDINILDKQLLSDGWDVKLKEKAWEYHLQKMVLEEDPLEYLERFLE